MRSLAGKSNLISMSVLQIRAIPEDMEFYGKGPLLACKYMDSGVLWQRAEQIAEVLDEARLPLFPYLLLSHMQGVLCEDCRTWPQSAMSVYIGAFHTAPRKRRAEQSTQCP